MQLSSRILTALAVLILAVAVVAVRAGSTDTVEAATGTIDVLNVGTCFATDDEIFGATDCNDGDPLDNDGDAATGDGYDVAERDEVGEVATVYATYAHDPKTAADDPRAILKNSNVIKISISDTGRDKRTPVLLPVGNAPVTNLDTTNCVDGNEEECEFDRAQDENLEGVEKGYLQIIQDAYPGIAVAETTMSWQRRGITTPPTPVANGGYDLDEGGTTGTRPGVETGISIVRSDTAVEYLPMDVEDDSLISFWGKIDMDGGANSFGDLVNLKAQLKLDEDVGSGGTGADDEENQVVAPWLSVQKTIPEGATVRLMYIVYHTSEWETLVGGNTVAAYADETPAIHVPDFSKAERDRPDSRLVVEARSDGRDGNANLRLRETGRFTGRYEGYLTLTDENGGGVNDGDGWGLDPDDADDATMDGAAVLGVESGPVVIAYKDTDGKTQLLEIEIDTVPPSVTIDSPAHKSEGQDSSPEFSGSFADTDSGLRDDTFRLYIDNTNDINEGSDRVFGVNALELTSFANHVAGPTGGGLVGSQEDYTGYGVANETFAVIGHGDVFKAATEDTKVVDGDNFDDGDATGTFGDSVRIDFNPETEHGNFNNTIDYQAVVADIAGNLGFSDSDDSGPTFINDLGTKSDDRKTGRYNVIGWYARHIFFLDETEPAIFEEQTVTGFYGINDDKDPVANRSGVLVAFDKAVDADSIGVDTFSVTLDKDGTQQVGIVDVDVQGRSVYLLLESELASDARPYVDISDGEWVSDPAGNRLTGGNHTAFEAKDGIAPILTVTLSGGSGSGEGAEGPSSLTKDSITATITADEEINSTPSLVVVCSNIGWDTDDVEGNDKFLADVGKQRSGSLANGSATFSPDTNDGEEDPNLYGATFDCGDDASDVKMQQLQSYSRPGLTWEYEWVNLTGNNALPDGKLTVVTFARDRQSFTSLMDRAIGADEIAADRYNWGTAQVEFRYDTMLNDPAPTPEGGATVTEARPFVLLNYDDATTISIDEFSIDGTVAEINGIGNNRFLYWPEALGLGTHEVSVEASDAAGNEDTFDYSFKVAERKAFNLKLIAGWNAVSFPANPIDNAIDSVFTEDVIDMIAGWDASDPEKPWSIATRMEGEWSTHEEYATLNKVHAQYGYWVHAQGFVTQRVKLIGGINRTDPDVTPPDLVSIPTLAGWNFVGVIDQDGDQTEADWGEVLMNGETAVNAGSYLGSNKRAYTWDAVRSEFQILEDGDDVAIGDGIWVYYGGGIAP